MRIHRLRAVAFGPFADPIDIDLDALTASGVFLIHGPTGAGKTSILDAICFALFGNVPGHRSNRSLRSDHAARDAQPVVTLDLTVGGRRLRIRRTAEFTRPKKRGHGDMRNHATVLLEERVSGGYRPLSTRIDEAAEVIDDIVGMGLAQFSRVALLPQGEFATFLRARPEDRRVLLEKLFDVSTYVDVEDWLAEQRRASRANVGQARDEQATDLLRLADDLAALPSEALPDDVDLAGLVDAGADTVAAACAAITSRLEEFVEGAAADRESADLAEQAAVRAAHDGSEQARLRRVGDRATEDLARLDAAVPLLEEHRRELESALAANDVSGHLMALDRENERLAAAKQTAADAAALVSALGLDDRSDSAVTEWLDRATGFDDSMIATAVASDELAAADAAVAGAGRALEKAESAEQAARTHAEGALGELERARDRVTVCSAAATRTETLELHEADLARLLRLHGDLTTARAAADHSAREALDAREREQQARQHVLDLRDSHLAGIAASLAAELVDGEPCRVCGSTTHPAAAPHALAVTDGEIAAAQAEHDTHRTAWEEAQERSVTDAARVDGLLEAVRERGDDLARLTDEHAAVAAGLAAARTLAAEIDAANTALDDAARAAGESRRALEAATEQRAELATRLVTAREALSAQRTLVVTALSDHGDACPCGGGRGLVASGVDSTGPAELASAVAAVTNDHRRIVAVVRSALDARLTLREVTSQQSATAAEALLACTTAGFADIDDARAAVLTADEREHIATTIEEHTLARARARAVLDDPRVIEALAGAEPDLASLTDSAQAARIALRRTTERFDLARRTLVTTSTLMTAIVARATELAPLAVRLSAMSEMADLVAGTSGNNAMRMSLSSFVLAGRLERVVELANERLASLADGRYVLRHDDGLAARGARSGLGLSILDQWTGHERATSTLSGGESFMASLALALGLSDAVREESGGFDLQTLFIDEGFGALDDESLDDVMAVLDGLRDGGRAIGVVSHVSDLRARIPSQLIVEKSPHGSTVRSRSARPGDTAVA